MARGRVIAAVDVGTTKICTLIGEVTASRSVEILGVGIAPSRGLRKGMIVDIDEAVEAIRASVEKAERSSGFQIVSAYVGIAGNHVGSINNRSIVTVAAPNRVIGEDDVARAMESARAVNLPNNREILHVIPRCYTIDGQEGVKNPIGMHGFRMDLESHIVTAASTAIQNLKKCIEQAGVEVDALVLEPIAASEAVLTDEERELGVVLADIGGGTTDIEVFVEGSPWHSAVLPVGGYHLTNDIAIGLRTPLVVAEQIKVSHGRATALQVESEVSVDVTGFATDGTRTVSHRQLCEIIEARVVEILEMILVEIKRAGYDSMLPAGLVLAGGTANLPGLQQLAEEVLEVPVRIGRPTYLQGLVDTVSNTAYAASVGLLLWGLRHGDVDRGELVQGQGSSVNIGGLYRRLSGWMKELLPQEG